MRRHPLIFAIAFLLLATAARAQSPERVESVVAHGSDQGQFLAVVSPVKKSDGTLLPTTIVRYRAFGGAGDAWQAYAQFDAAVRALGERGGDLAVLLEVGQTGPGRTQLRFVYNPLERGRGPRDLPGPTPPPGVALTDIAGGTDGGPLFALGYGPDGPAAWALAGTQWQPLPPLPQSLAGLTERAVDLGAVGGRAVVAGRTDDATVEVFTLTGEAWQSLGRVPLGPGERFLLIDASDSSAGVMLYLFGPGDRVAQLGEPPNAEGADGLRVVDVEFRPRENVASLAADDPRAATVALGSLRLVRAAAATHEHDGVPGQVLLELPLDPTTLQPVGEGGAAVLSFPSTTPEEFREQVLQLLLYALLILALVSVLRQRPLPAAERLRDVGANLAPLSLRFLAGVVDLLPLVVSVGFWLAARGRLSEAGELTVLTVGLAVYLGHLVAAEALTGRSMGKAMFGLRVVRTDGEPADTWAIILRNVLRPLDAPAVGLGLAYFSPLRQRLGDMAAGTTVVRVLVPDREP